MSHPWNQDKHLWTLKYVFFFQEKKKNHKTAFLKKDSS